MSGWITEWLRVHDTADIVWLGIGLVAQLSFSARFLIQWISSEKEGRSVIPVAFWWLSLVGGLLLLAYGIQRGEPVIILGQMFGIVVYIRNLWLIRVERQRSIA